MPVALHHQTVKWFLAIMNLPFCWLGLCFLICHHRIYWLFSLPQIIINSLPNLTSGVWLKDLVLWRSAGTLKGLSIFALAFSCQTWVSSGPRHSVQMANTDFDLLQCPPFKFQAIHNFQFVNSAWDTPTFKMPFLSHPVSANHTEPSLTEAHHYEE